MKPTNLTAQQQQICSDIRSNLTQLTAQQRQLRSNIRAFLITATQKELEKELQLSVDRKDYFRAEVIQELISEY